MNVLVTSAARKVWLVRAFQRAWQEVGGVIAADIDPTAAALYAADDRVLLPRSDAPEFLDRTLEACAKRDVTLVVPTRDDELQVFATARSRFEQAGIRVHVSAPDAIARCQDKLAFHSFCDEHGFPVPARIREPSLADLPLFARPRFGKGSHGARLLISEEDLEGTQASDTLYNSFVSAPEYTVDLFIARDGQFVGAVPRERIRVVGGESQVSRTVDDQQLARLSAALVQALGLEGHVTVQAFHDEHGVHFIEVNPRFGGAASLGIAAGLDSPRWLLSEVQGEPVLTRDWSYERDLVLLRHPTDLFVRWDQGRPPL